MLLGDLGVGHLSFNIHLVKKEILVKTHKNAATCQLLENIVSMAPLICGCRIQHVQRQICNGLIERFSYVWG